MIQEKDIEKEMITGEIVMMENNMTTETGLMRRNLESENLPMKDSNVNSWNERGKRKSTG